LPAVTPEDELGIAYRLTEEVMARKLAAARAQESQSAVLFEAMGDGAEDMFWLSNGVENFRIAATRD
jgi:hypothetical protein